MKNFRDKLYARDKWQKVALTPEKIFILQISGFNIFIWKRIFLRIMILKRKIKY